MRCMVCDAEMILMKVVPDDTMPVPGFERRTFICSACQDVEQHLAFVKPGCESDAEPVPVHAASSNAGRQGDREQPALLVDAAPPIAGEQSSDQQPMPMVDAAPSTVPASEVLDQRPVARSLFGRAVAKVRGR